MAQDASTWAGSWAGSRALLRRLRDLMAGSGAAEQRLHKIVTLIAANLVAEVCSVYVRRAGDVLELFATEGLSQDAVHRTRLQLGEGLVGDIAAHARPLALADAQSHPQFALRTETGEEIYSSFMGVPIVRDGRVLGVLAVQNRTPRTYADEELETLETIAMLLAEIVTSGELVAPGELHADANLLATPSRLEGVRASPGLTMGTALLHQPKIMITNVLADDPEIEQSRIDEALSQVQSALDTALERPDLAGAGEHRDILEMFRMFAQDRGWIKRINEAIQTGLTAEAAVQMVQDDTRARLSQASDRYLRERLLDFEDLTNQMLTRLVGSNQAPAPIGENAILVARGLGPSELLSYRAGLLSGIILEEGSATAHIAIVARALDLAMVVQVPGILDRVSHGDDVLIDADEGHVFLRPADDILESFNAAMMVRDDRQRAYAAIKNLPAISQDGTEVRLMINAGLPVDAARLSEVGAQGIGLYRTEISFLAKAEFPNIAAQAEIYSQVFDSTDDDQPIVFRTLDIGGDKLFPSIADAGEENPAMGWRSLRISLDRPAVLRQQLRALILAAAGRNLHVMFPMLTDVGEFSAARSLLERELERAKHLGTPRPKTIKVGAMLEIPALAWSLSSLLPKIDFLSIGSNDLAQFFFAADRNNPRIDGRYDALSPTFLSLLASLREQAEDQAVPINICGEIAGRTLEAMALVGIGYRSLSMSAGSVGPIKSMIRSTDIAKLSSFTEELLLLPISSLRTRLRAYAKDHNIDL